MTIILQFRTTDSAGNGIVKMITFLPPFEVTILYVAARALAIFCVLCGANVVLCYSFKSARFVLCDFMKMCLKGRSSVHSLVF